MNGRKRVLTAFHKQPDTSRLIRSLIWQPRPWLGEETIMRSIRMRVFVTGIAAAAIGVYAETNPKNAVKPAEDPAVSVAVNKAVKWLVSVQGQDGGWGQDGGETSYIRK